MAGIGDSTGTNSKGRPKLEVDLTEISELISIGFTKTQIAEMLGISRKTLYNKTIGQQSVAPKYTHINDSQLDTEVSSIKESHPNDREILIAGHLLHKGIRVPRAQLRRSIHRVDPEGVAKRRSSAVKRRLYQVSHANEVWHIDGNHKLIKWRFVVHGGIDGYSRIITFLDCHTNNCADTVLSSFIVGVNHYGLPKKVRTDHGGENCGVW